MTWGPKGDGAMIEYCPESSQGVMAEDEEALYMVPTMRENKKKLRW